MVETGSLTFASIGWLEFERPVDGLQHMPPDAFDAVRDVGIRLYSHLIPRADRDEWDLKYLRGFQDYLHLYGRRICVQIHLLLSRCMAPMCSTSVSFFHISQPQFY